MTETETEYYPYRIFLSYARTDKDIAQRIITFFRNKNIKINWDQDLPLGVPFSNTIKELIAHSHIFIILVSSSSKKRSWINQETGFAIAMNIPVLMIKIDEEDNISKKQVGSSEAQKRDQDIDEEDKDLAMIRTLQSITIKTENLEVELKRKVSNKKLEELVNPRPPHPMAPDIVYWPEKRTEMLAEYANREYKFGNYCEIRQKATFSSFYLPSADSDNSIWKELDGKRPRSHYFHYLLTMEREALEQHARFKGCKLILDPTNVGHAAGKEAVEKRFEEILNFLEYTSKDIGVNKVKVAISSTARKSHITIVGDWFFAESQTPTPEGYLQTMFNFHAPTVYQKILQFDKEFDRIQQANAIFFNGRSELQYAIDEIKKAIESLDNDHKKD